MRYMERERAILDFASNQRVLHLGCVGFETQEPSTRIELAKNSLHASLSQAADVLGVDYSESLVREYKRLGVFNNIIVGDVEALEELNIREKFDVIVAGDIIEHLSNPGLLLEGLKIFCRADTKVIITTPNAFSLPNYLRYTVGRAKDSYEHVMMFSMQNIERLLIRHGYALKEIGTCHQASAEGYGFIFKIGRAFFKRFPKLGGTLFVVAQLN